MSDESRREPRKTRVLHSKEKALIKALLDRLPPNDFIVSNWELSLVSDMDDGGMGSIRFVGSAEEELGKQLIEAKYQDSDDVLVSITLNADKHGNLYELDFWKVNFEPLRRYPSPSDLILK